jgi:hypothetical protein
MRHYFLDWRRFTRLTEPKDSRLGLALGKEGDTVLRRTLPKRQNACYDGLRTLALASS